MSLIIFKHENISTTLLALVCSLSIPIIVATLVTFSFSANQTLIMIAWIVVPITGIGGMVLVELIERWDSMTSQNSDSVMQK